MTGRTWHCDYAPEFGHLPAMDCWTAYLTEEAWQAHLQRWHPSRRRWDQPAPPDHRSPMIDDELSITLRVRLTPAQLEVLRQPEHRDLLMAAAAQAVQAMANLPGDLAGVDLSLPTFEPIKVPATKEA